MLLIKTRVSLYIFLALGILVAQTTSFNLVRVLSHNGAQRTANSPNTWAKSTSRIICKSGDDDNNAQEAVTNEQATGKFDLTTALFCAGLAFDAYSEPSDSSRWEKGSKGLNVAFVSNAYTRSLYKGIVEVTPLNATDLPDEEDNAEKLVTGGGVDAYLLVAVAEGKMLEDLKTVEKTEFSEGVIGLQDSSHMGRSSTAWSNVDEKEGALRAKKGYGGAYHIKSSWGKGGKAIWKDEPPFYLYVSDPPTARLVCTVMDEEKVGEDQVVGSFATKLSYFAPLARYKDPVEAAKQEIIKKMKTMDGKISEEDLRNSVMQSYEGTNKLRNKPRKKDKKGQVAMGMAAGAMLAGPLGAAVGAGLGNMFEGEVKGAVSFKLRYLPIPNVDAERKRYEVKGGLPGVDWGLLYEKHLAKTGKHVGDYTGQDLEMCVFVTNEKTGCSCAIYRSLEKKIIAVTFRGTCELIDLITDANLIQTPWVEGADKEAEDVLMVHVGFRASLNSISRRLKELILAAVPAGQDLSEYDLIVTGHSLGGALATLFTADVAEYGMDAGRRCPQLEPSEPWFTSLLSFGNKKTLNLKQAPPKPKSIRLYSFGSPRVGNDAFVANFDSLLKENKINEAYRIVNDADVVARLPRSVSFLGMASVGYDHCGPTALISLPEEMKNKDNEDEDGATTPIPKFWVEGESDDAECPVRDGTTLTSPMANGMLLGDIVNAVKSANVEEDTPFEKNGNMFSMAKLGDMAKSVQGRLSNFEATDLVSLFGIRKEYAEREAKLIKTIASGEALGHHMEDEYYGAMGRASGFIARVGEDVTEMQSVGVKEEI
eukprot:CAMPEP_0195510144 /NCGR_PEP_ID=MMETSP0794_2-20130614/2883_1 /TAXON_ID=515487 /ORGANISM="Stephanopyxis turris, Strain CCMP 815" /LENGTH=820 /DNA_ID=CAMNT_0040637519 /DNA_START=32 /DNA_END=2497 /DNA_ORIENTATION=-